MSVAIDLGGLVLERGVHERGPECCVMEATAILACALADPEPPPTWEEAFARFGETCKTDHPEGACRVISAFLRQLNDRMTDTERQRLKPYALRLVNTRVPLAVEIRRAYIMADVAVRVFAPIALDARGLTHHAATLRAADPIVNKTTAATAVAADFAADFAAAFADSVAAAFAAVAADSVAANAAVVAADFAAAAAVAAADSVAANAAVVAAARPRLVDEALAAVDRMLTVTA